MRKIEWEDGGGYFTLQIPENIIQECSHGGECYHDCVKNIKKISWRGIDPTRLHACLSDYSDWVDRMDPKNLSKEDILDLKVRVLWVACGDILDNPDDYDYKI